MQDNLVVIRKFWSVEEAHLAQSFLEGHGISSVLEGVAASGALWHMNNATGGVKLQVPQHLAAQSEMLLEGIERSGKRESARSATNSSAPAKARAADDADDDEGEFDDDDSDDGLDESDDVNEHRGFLDNFAFGKTAILWLWLIPAVVLVGSQAIAVLQSIVNGMM